MSSLYEIGTEIAKLQEQLAEAADENGVIDPNHPAITEINIQELLAIDKVENIARYIEHLNAVAVSEKAYAEELSREHLVASRTAENRVKWLKESIKRFMIEQGTESIETRHYTLKVQNNGGVLPVKVDAAFDVSVKEIPEKIVRTWPEELYRVVFVAVPERIREWKESGKELPAGVTAERGKQLRIKGEK
jgi:hypothetical protein